MDDYFVWSIVMQLALNILQMCDDNTCLCYGSVYLLLCSSRFDFGSNALYSTSISYCLPNRPWWRHQMETFYVLLAICAGNSPAPVNSPHKGQWRGALMLSFNCVSMNGWVNNRKAGDLRHYRTHYDVTVMHHATSRLPACSWVRNQLLTWCSFCVNGTSM